MNAFIQEYKSLGALWIHSGNPAHPHAELASGLHSNGFFNSRILIANDDVMRRAVAALIERYNRVVGASINYCGFVGPATGATKLAEMLAENRCKAWQLPCRSVSPTKADTPGSKVMQLTADEKSMVSARRFILCEDVVSTGGSSALAAKAVEHAGGKLLPYMLALVNRSGKRVVAGRTVIALVDHEMPTWEPDACPLCQQGSKAIRPKDNWAELNGNEE